MVTGLAAHPENEPLLVIVGPTASGKTELSLVLAETLDAEIISADSVQIYRHFDVGSGKPTAEELARVPHHLMGTHDPLDDIDAARWAGLAEDALQRIVARGKRPIVCGGSFLWVRALLFGLAPAPAADASLRAEYQRIADEQGRAALHTKLAAVDAETAAKLAPNDFVRVSRALEVFELTGKKMSEWQAEHGFREPKRPFQLIGVKRERAELDERIHRRAALMLEHGLLEEVFGLCRRGYGTARAMGSVGYREVYEALRESVAVTRDELAPGAQAVTDGAVRLDAARLDAARLDAARLDAARLDAINVERLLDAIARKTRIFARRQRTWLRDEPVRWIPPEL
ncbi:MAG: tRNA (adenosine(37)-N6)-dimethylallyltransferase MiaA, partial [Myxococcales bacterium]